MRELDRLKKEWRAGSRVAAYTALVHCRRAKVAIPDWVLDAIEFDGHEVAVQKFRKEMESHHYRQSQQDRSIHQQVLDWRERGLTWERAYEKTAETAGTFDDSKLTSDRVKNAYVRIRRLEKSRKLV